MNIDPKLPSAVADSGPSRSSPAAEDCARIFSAIKHGYAHTALDLIERFDPNLSASNKDGQTPLHLAVALDDRELASEIIASLPAGHSALNARDRQEYTPLMLAVENGSVPLSKALIEKGGDIPSKLILPASGARAEKILCTLHAAELLLEARGDMGVAYTLALRDKDTDFQRRFAGALEALRTACADGDMVEAQRMLDEGMDASSALTMEALSVAEPATPSRARVLTNLRALGADPTVSMRQVLLRGEKASDVCHLLLLLGADPHQAMVDAARNGDAKGLKRLLDFGFNINDAVVRVAKAGDGKALSLMLSNGRLNAEDRLSIFQTLAKAGQQEAVKLLIDRGQDPAQALSRAFETGDRATARVLFEAGGNVSSRLNALAADCRVNPDEGMKRLEALIAAGVDSSYALYDTAKGGKDPVAVHTLIAAGARVPEALGHALASELPDIEETLASASNNVAALKRMMDDAGDSGSALLTTLLLAKDDIADPAKSDRLRRLEAMAGAYDMQGDRACADLLRALLQVDWIEIKALVTADPDASSRVLLDLSRETDVVLGRILAAAQADPHYVFAFALRDGWMGDTSLKRLSFMLDIGYEPYEVVNALLELNEDDAAKALIAQRGLNVIELLDVSARHDNKEEFQRFTSRMTDSTGLIAPAIRQGRSQLLAALLAAGIQPEPNDTEEHLLGALRKGHIDVLQPLRAAGVEVTQASERVLVEAMGTGNTELAQLLKASGVAIPPENLDEMLVSALEDSYDVTAARGCLALGANVSSALMQASAAGQSHAVKSLLYLGGDVAPVRQSAFDQTRRVMEMMGKLTF
ncbi:ankyrin repeat domain-containing protein [Bordetella sp. 02P26C-1]|uniref:ankyrin repeat domain-containing protein n=1 Tax=Bordetella sp. 02P26C-1 TaxID=2683195 RepID=UPI00135392C1|nr:ankyrin repeat domain-containing protein [Bordetella sp. 02P26C-1]MVW80786.1 hypothetical protein [Bordetella sp. 02P26C-1]